MTPNQVLRRMAAGLRVCNRHVSCPPLMSLGRQPKKTMPQPGNSTLLLFGLLCSLLAACSDERDHGARRIDHPPVNRPAEFITKAYAVPEDYQNILAEHADQRAGTKVPAGTEDGRSVIREPWPSQSLKILGLELREGYQMLNQGNGTLIYRADARGHQEFMELNRSLHIPIQEGTELPESTNEGGGGEGDDEPPF